MDNNKLEMYRHSASHIMAQAVKHLFPEAKLGIGPAIEDGFYYDFELKNTLTDEDLLKIEEEMKKIIAQNYPFVQKETKKDEALKLFNSFGEKYKVELLNELQDDKITIYTQGDFIDLCRGPHIESTGEIKAFKLLSVAGAYWRGSEKNPMLQRIYGTAFETENELKEYLDKCEEAKKRDHRRLGKDLDLYSIYYDEAGAGLIYWHPKGAFVRNIIENFCKEELFKRGYDLVNIPHIAKIDLWKTSGHLEFYKENMYSPIKIDEQEYIVKPMNCPGHILIYKSKIRSYRELSIRFAELGTVYRYEKSGVLHGLLRVRGFTQDDAHIFCRQEQLENELVAIIDMVSYVLKTFGFESYDVFLSTKPEKFVGTDENWQKATDALRLALEKCNLKYTIDPGEGVFYGPKIDIKIKDSIGRVWQCSTIQVDFNLPERFDVNYIGEDGKEHRVVMIHRAIFGSLERFFGILIEHWAGSFPVWLSPIQARIIPITDSQIDYAKELKNKLSQVGLRADIDTNSEKMGSKIRSAELEKIPYMIIIGKKEIENNVISLRARKSKDLGQMPLEKFIQIIKEEIDQKK